MMKVALNGTVHNLFVEGVSKCEFRKYSEHTNINRFRKSLIHKVLLHIFYI